MIDLERSFDSLTNIPFPDLRDSIVARAGRTPGPPFRGRPQRLSRVLVASLAIAIFTLSAGFLWVSFRPASETPSTAGLSISKHLQLDNSARGLAASQGALWAAGTSGGARERATRIDPSTDRVIWTTALGRGSGDIAVGEGAAWVTNIDDETVTRLDPASGKIVAVISRWGSLSSKSHRFLFLPYHVTTGEGAVWVLGARGMLAGIDPDTNRMKFLLDLTNKSSVIGEVAVAGGYVWVSDAVVRTLRRVDPRRGTVTSAIDLGGAAYSMTAIGDTLWLGIKEADRAFLVEVDAVQGNVVRRIPLQGEVVSGIAASASSIWALVDSKENGRQIVRVDAASGAVVGKASFQGPTGMRIVSIGESAWLTTVDDTLLEVKP